MAETSIERVQTIEARLSENLIYQILNDDDLFILIDDLQDDVNLATTIGVLPADFSVKEDQPIQLDGDVLAEDAAQATLVNDTYAAGDHLEKKGKDDIEEVIRFEKPQLARHLKPLCIKVYIDGRPISQVLIIGGAIMNVMPVES